MPRVVIAEPAHDGHKYTYVKLLVEAVTSLTRDVVLLLSPEGMQSAEFRTNLESLVGGMDVRPVLRNPRPGMLKAAADGVSNVRRAVREANPDVLYFPTADGLAEAVGFARMAGLSPLPRGVHAECLMTRLTFAYPGDEARRMVPVPAVLAALRNSPWETIHLIDLLAYEWVQRHGGPLKRRFRVAPDPVEQYPPLTRAEARRRLDIPEDGRYLVCPGILIARKGIDRLVEAFRTADLRQEDRLLLAGPVGPEIRELLQGEECSRLMSARRLLVIDRYLSGEEMACVMSAGDVVCCPYPWQPHPSSISVKALGCGRPVLGADNCWLGYMIPRFEMGWTVGVNDAAAFAVIVRRCLDEAPQWQPSEAARRLVEFQSADNFKACWSDGVRRLMGMPSLSRHGTWDWVNEALQADAGDRRRFATGEPALAGVRACR